MSFSHDQKVTTEHLKRDAYLYVRQSTLRQVVQNTESTQRQYALRQRATALGWPEDRIIVIDGDLGQSGASADDREGFQRLVAEVGMGRAGIVLGLEVSRLARNSSDWHRLLEICGLTETLILDEDGLYDPGHFNDRLLLGLKGTMSEAELHVLHARLQGGVLNKARRGELKVHLPVGFVYDLQDRVVLDPDQQVQQAIRLLFETYDRTGTACGVVKYLDEKNLLFPCRIARGANKGTLVWRKLAHSRVLQILHNPRYAGAFVYGRFRMNKLTKESQRLPQDQWRVVITDAHAGYVTWQQYQEHQRRLRECAQMYGRDRRKSPPGEGPALLQGLAVCGRCGHRMTVRYHRRAGRLVPSYVCQAEGIEYGKRVCQTVPGQTIDDAIGELLLELMTPATVEVSLAVFEELQNRYRETDGLRRKQVERARFEADLAQQRFVQVHPDNRLVADVLEADWNERLRTLSDAREEYEERRQADRLSLDEEGRQRILALVSDFPKLWRDSRTSDRGRKRMVRLLIEDATLIKADAVQVQIRFKGGAGRELELPLPDNAWQLRQTEKEVICEIDRLLDSHTAGDAAEELNRCGHRTGEGLVFTGQIVARLRRDYNLKSRYDRLRESGKLTQEELAEKLGVSTTTIQVWRRHGLLVGYPFNDKNECLYNPPDENAPVKSLGRKLSDRRRFPKNVPDSTDEV